MRKPARGETGRAKRALEGEGEACERREGEQKKRERAFQGEAEACKREIGRAKKGKEV